MENHKIDRLFQDKLSRHEVDPSPQAWEAINAELRNDNNPMVWLSIAASVALVATIGWLMIRNDQVVVSDVNSLAAADQPSPQPPYEWNFTSPVDEQPVDQKETKKTVKKQVVPAIEKISMNETLAQEANESVEIDETLLEIEPMGLDAMANIAEASMVLEEPELDTTPIPSLPGVGVQITYKATPPTPVEEKSRLEKLWAKAKEIRPGDVLADIRETKNDFFNGKKN